MRGTKILPEAIMSSGLYGIDFSGGTALIHVTLAGTDICLGEEQTLPEARIKPVP
jgi:hypothetical protein